jgi:hypothetical protein
MMMRRADADPNTVHCMMAWEGLGIGSGMPIEQKEAVLRTSRTASKRSNNAEW